jgi:hypothetical protein
MVDMAISMCLFRLESLSAAIAWISLQAKFCKSGAECLKTLLAGGESDFLLFHKYTNETVLKRRRQRRFGLGAPWKPSACHAPVMRASQVRRDGRAGIR